MDCIDVNRVLPPNLCIPTAGTHLYKYGLSLYAVINANRSFIFHPIVVFISTLIMLIKNILVEL